MADVEWKVAGVGVTQPVRPGARPYRIAGGGMALMALLLSLLALLPLGFVVGITLETDWETIKALVFRPRVGELLLNTVLLVVVTLPLCTLLGVALAWLTERTTLPGRRVWSLLLTAPLAVPAFVQSYAWISLLPGMHGLAAGVFLSVLAYFPFIYLPAAAVLRRLDPSLEDVATSLGARPWRVFFRVVLPQLRLAVWGGSLLIALHLLAEYGLYAMIRFDTFTTAIFEQFQSTFNGLAANMLAGVLVLCCLGLLLLEALTRGRARYARVGSGSARSQSPRRLSSSAALVCVLLPLALTVLALGVPLMTLARWLWLGGLEVWRNDELWPALRQTLWLGVGGAALVTLCAFPMAWLSVRHPSRLYRLLEGCNYITSALPGIVVALALVTVTIHTLRPLYQTEFTLLLAYVLMFMPRALINLRAGIAQAPVELENVARSLGCSPGRALWRITLRLAAPGAAAGAAMVFLAVTNELTATLLLAPNGTRTLATGFWALTSEIDYMAAAPYALIMVMLSLPLTWLLYSQSKRTAGL
ncbi:Sulfate transport system permease protein CysW [Dickeya dianthicola]|uniref:Iron ABC transporter permease n=20 Tax=Dickeya dianthicola TaxID=204039 RepID=A0AAP6S1G5_9GAMM|nr:iron ABC transporter permease [Dickeya dianthicola]ATO32675.1 Ferric iron ABC transporter, permease protein [Dickeya dianthicola RNS04.9]AYC18645.1 Sulfate transport system permease protein CysW [Dickeya dianthicola]MBT1427721.1 iron ABC transporter permease [Dickeya dianthicola]MBT1431788.1 iron ABC transporter permease [Dickeya dianthicola]MBT1459234.1 iron ABC transporter permease [Dickeya dianthicola]